MSHPDDMPADILWDDALLQLIGTLSDEIDNADAEGRRSSSRQLRHLRDEAIRSATHQAVSNIARHKADGGTHT